MYPIEVPDSLLELADVTRPDHLDANDVMALIDRIQRSEVLVSDWVDDPRFWSTTCREGFAQTLGGILPHVTNGEYALAALIQSRADIPEDPALRAKKALIQMQIQLAEFWRHSLSDDDAGMDRTSQLLQVLDDVFMAASGGLLMSANLVTQGYPLSVHSAILEAGAKTVLTATKSLRQHIKSFNPVVY